MYYQNGNEIAAKTCIFCNRNCSLARMTCVILLKVIFNGTYQLMDSVAWEMSLRGVDQSVLIDNIEDEFDWERLL
jgi:hypothetical protein